MKLNSYVQYGGKEIRIGDYEKKVKDIWSEKGNLQKDLKTIQLYFKVEENTCYYVINGSFSGGIPIEA